MPGNQWPTLVGTLAQNVVGASPRDSVVKASLDAIGCEAALCEAALQHFAAHNGRSAPRSALARAGGAERKVSREMLTGLPWAQRPSIPRVPLPEHLRQRMVHLTPVPCPLCLSPLAMRRPTARYICEDMDASRLPQGHVNALLTAIVSGMRRGGGQVAAVLAGSKALLHALDFARGNFEHKVVVVL